MESAPVLKSVPLLICLPLSQGQEKVQNDILIRWVSIKTCIHINTIECLLCLERLVSMSKWNCYAWSTQDTFAERDGGSRVHRGNYLWTQSLPLIKTDSVIFLYIQSEIQIGPSEKYFTWWFSCLWHILLILTLKLQWNAGMMSICLSTDHFTELRIYAEKVGATQNLKMRHRCGWHVGKQLC